MSKLETPLAPVGDYESNLPEQDENVNPSWSVQNITFSLGVPFKLSNKQRTSPQALPLDRCLESPSATEYSFSWRAAEEQGFYNPWPLGFGDADALGNEGPMSALALRSPSLDVCGNGKYCALDSTGSEVDQNSSSEGSGEAQGGYVDPGREEAGGVRASSENTGDGDWDGVVNLLRELNTKFSDATTLDSPVTEKLEQKPETMGEQPNPGGKGIGIDLSTPCSGPEEILRVLAAIQRNVEKLVIAVPKLASQRQKFTSMIQRQCAAAAGAVRLISQLAESAAALLPDILSSLDAIPSESGQLAKGNNWGGIPSESCESAKGNNLGNECSTMSLNPLVAAVSREEGGNVKCAEMDSLGPTLAAVSISLDSSTVSGKDVCEAAIGAVKETAVVGASDLGRIAESECASSLVADLLGPCERMTGEDGFQPPATPNGGPFRWGNDLEEAIKRENVSQLSEELPFENRSDDSPSGTNGASDEDLRSNAAFTVGAQDESDDADIKGSDHFPFGPFTLMEIDDLEILTEQTHYCNICSKGFKRDANLRMHMRSHGGQYKSSTALTRSERAPKLAQEMVGGKPTRYSCPFVGCNRNMRHPKFQALKTMLCLKNHYRRSHCLKTLKCSICKSKQFAVVADLKTHEKHCGSDKWACSCGTTFSRKEKLYGHVSLFVGHIPVDACTGASLASEVGISEGPVQVQQTNDVKGSSSAQNAAFSTWQDFQKLYEV